MKTLLRIACLTLSIMLALGCASALADTEQIEVLYNDIKVYINGALTSFVDSFGNEVEPFIYNGNVYLPLPAIADAVGLGYSWDGANMSANIGTEAGEKQYLLDVCPPYQDYGVTYYTTQNGKSFSMAGQSYTNGMRIPSSSGSRFALFNLNGKYKTMNFVLGHIDNESMRDVKLQIYLDGVLAGEYEVIAEGLPYEVSLPLKNALSMKIIVVHDSYVLDCSGIAEITVE